MGTIFASWGLFLRGIKNLKCGTVSKKSWYNKILVSFWVHLVYMGAYNYYLHEVYVVLYVIVIKYKHMSALYFS